jgi:hypothetical protein
MMQLIAAKSLTSNEQVYQNYKHWLAHVLSQRPPPKSLHKQSCCLEITGKISCKEILVLQQACGLFHQKSAPAD